MMKLTKGFTLIELLAVLSIIGIITSFGLPAFFNILENQKATSTTHQLYRYLNYARTEAISKNQVISVCGSIDNKTCSKKKDWSDQSVLIFIDNDQDGQIGKDNQIIKTTNFRLEPESLIWRSFRNKSYLQWLPSGMTHYQNGNFTYCPPSKNPRHAKSIIMNAAGRMYFGSDKNNDGIPEGRNGKNIQC